MTMTTMEMAGWALLSLAVALAGINIMARAYRAGVNEGRRQAASRDVADLIEEGNER